MRKSLRLLLLLCLALPLRVSAAAGDVVPVTFGPGVERLQRIVDARYGKGHIDVTRDFIGAHAGDFDPWFWVGDRIGAVWVTMVKRDPHENLVGWYIESAGQAVTPPGGGVIFSGKSHPNEVAMVTIPGFRTCFGFYIEGPTPGYVGPLSVKPGPGRPVVGKRFYTGRKLNDCGPDGNGALHAPYDGDVQALVFDVSRWSAPNTWLVCFEDEDTGGILTVGDDGDDDNGGDGRLIGLSRSQENDPEEHDREHRPRGSNSDFDDVIFEVRADGATPAHPLSFGALKLLYR